MSEPAAVESVEAGQFTVGVEEEYLLLDAETRAPVPEGERLVRRARQRLGDTVHTELQQAQLEVSTPVCDSLDAVRRHLGRQRREVAEMAASAGAVIAASGTHPFSSWRDHGRITPTPAYLQLESDYQQLAREQLICGCHVHVGIDDPELAIEVVNRVRTRLPVVLAVAANSPFWEGVDTGYASYRTEIWRRWPTAGTPDVFASRAEYDSLVQALLDTGSIDARARIYWDVRPSARFSTIEFRVTDVCLTVDEAVMVTGLVRALARTSWTEAVSGAATAYPRSELLRAATWRAARYGLEAELIDVAGRRSRPAGEVVTGTLQYLRPALEEAGDWDEISRLVDLTLRRGTGAARQRAAYARAGSIDHVVDLIVGETAGLS